MQQIFERHEAHKAAGYVRRYRCATCWGLLVERIIPGGGSSIECVKADDECDKAGFVTLAYVNRRRSEDQGDLFEAQANLPFLKPERSAPAADIIKSITGE